MRKKAVVVILALLSVSIFSFFHFQGTQTRGIDATVYRVIDGDTIELANHDIVRLIGVDAPEKGQPYYEEVVEELKKLEGKYVRLEKDKTNKDRYDRYLRYVFLDGSFVNLELVRSGMVYAYMVLPDNRYEKELLEAENSARLAGMGVWDMSEHSPCVSLGSFHYNAKGEDDKNVNDEFFVVENSCSHDIKTEGWTVRNRFRQYAVPDSAIKSGSRLKIMSGKGQSAGEDAFLSSEKPVWSNKGDSLYLRDASGKIILSKSYKNP